MHITPPFLTTSAIFFFLAFHWLAMTSSLGAKVAADTKMAAANNEFSLEMYREVGSTVPGGNVFLSPVSILIGLGMVRAGANGQTKSQLTKSMHLDQYNGDESAISGAFKGLISTFNDPGNNYTLRTANRLFAREGLQLKQDFLQTTEEYFQAGLEALNFAENPEGSRRTINDWVSGKTERKIENLLPDGSITVDTALVMINAIYFKGMWLRNFQKRSTKPEDFYLNHHEKTSIEMMSRRVANFNYHNSTELGCQVLELPYIGEQVSMLVFLPHDIEGLPSVESRLNSASLERVLRSLVNTRVKPSLPKFSLDQKVALREFLEQLGMTDMFDRGNADLSGIDGTKRLYVTKAVHKAFIAVDEEGTEAAGATGFVLSAKSAVMKDSYVEFVADRPFVFMVLEKSSSSVLFVGRLVVPPESGSGDIGEFGKTAEQRCCGSGGDDGAGAASPGPGVFLGLGCLMVASILMMGI